MSDQSAGIEFRTTQEAAAATITVARRAPSCWERRAPSCGARTRAGGVCLGVAMASGQCRLHGGASTGPRTQAGLARMVAAKTTHGRTATSSASKRLTQRHARTLIERIRQTDVATQLRGYLPAGMAARLDKAPDELKAPKHPSQVAFEALQAAAGRTGVPAPLGLGRRARAARARLGADSGAQDGAAAVALRGRATERRAMRAEAASQTPWRAAIAAARGLERAMTGHGVKFGINATTLCAVRRRRGGGGGGGGGGGLWWRGAKRASRATTLYAARWLGFGRPVRRWMRG